MKYGNGYERGKLHFETEQKLQNLHWNACDKLYDSAMENYNNVVAAIEKALKRIQDMEK